MHKTNHKSFVFLDKVYSKTSNDVFHGQCPKYDIWVDIILKLIKYFINCFELFGC